MADEIYRYDEQVSAGTVPHMVKEILEKHDYEVVQVEAPAPAAHFIGDDGSEHALRGVAAVIRKEDGEVRQEQVEYEVGPTHNDGAYTFVDMSITLWVPK